MRFIKEAIQLFFKKEEGEKRELILTDKQKKKYKKQYWSIMFPITLISVVLVVGIVESIEFLFKTKALVWVGIIIVFFKIMIEELHYANREIKLIQERIWKRQQKNIKQGKNIGSEVE